MFVAKGDDYDCTANKDPQIISSNRIKNLNFTITSGIGYQEYVVATIVPLCVFALFYVFSFAVFILFLIRYLFLLSTGCSNEIRYILFLNNYSENETIFNFTLCAEHFDLNDCLCYLHNVSLVYFRFPNYGFFYCLLIH